MATKKRRKKLDAMLIKDIDLKKAYKLQRAYTALKAIDPKRPLYKMWDKKIEFDGKTILSRIYEPNMQGVEKRKQVILFFHGGGWATESVDTYNKTCVNLANYTGCRVMSVQYRLAPENPFPDGLDDCYCVLKELIEHPEQLDTTADDVILMGDSAGGNFAAVLSLVMRELGAYKIKRQILFYPVLNSDYTENSPFESVVTNGEGYILTSKHMQQYIDLYVTDKAALRTPYVAPILADSFESLPETLVVTAEFDPLCDEGEYYVRRLEKAGVYAKSYRMKGVCHGFFNEEPKFEAVQKSYKLINKFIDVTQKRMERESRDVT